MNYKQPLRQLGPDSDTSPRLLEKRQKELDRAEMAKSKRRDRVDHNQADKLLRQHWDLLWPLRKRIPM